MDTLLVYLRNSLRLAGLLLLGGGVVLTADSLWVLLMTGDARVWTFDGLIHIPHWVRQASPLIQGLCGWPLILLDTVPTPVLLLSSGLLAISR